MELRISLLICSMFLTTCVICNESENKSDIVTTTISAYDEQRNIDYKIYRERTDGMIKRFENGLKKFIRDTIKSFMPKLYEYNNEATMSTKCTSSLIKYVSGLSSVKVWAIKMFDSMSKPPSGIFEGTVSDFGAFDQCLEIELPKRNGDIEFRGKYCAIEAAPIMPKPFRNFSLAKLVHAGPLDTIGKEVEIGGMAFYYLKFRLGICVPSTCSLQDMQAVAKRISDISRTEVRIPQCYVKESSQWKTIHIVTLCMLSALLLACFVGSVIEYKYPKSPNENQGGIKGVLKCFSLISNYNRLMSSSKGSDELKALHGIKGISILWVVLGHTYVWTNFTLLRRPDIIPNWFNSIDFGLILNTWLAVETFFFMSGLLTSYTVLKIMIKTKGRISVPIYILRRYIRLTPPLLLTVGLLFFLPLISSGPFWYEMVDPELKACTNYWWTSILYISNWMEKKNICVHPTWYLSADFQLHVVSIAVLYLLHKWPKLGLSFIAAIIISCNVIVGILTYLRDIPPIILITSGNNVKIEETVEIVHIRTFTHAGPYYIGIVVGYMMIHYNNFKIPKVFNASGWVVSTAFALLSIYGAHRWNIGEPHGMLLTAVFAAAHRSTYTLSIAWVTFVCVTGNGGLVNRLLSSAKLAPLSRLTFMMYLLHSLVIWTRNGSLRERMFFSHYNVLYEYTANLVVTFLLAIPFYLLLEAPLSNLERLLFSSLQKKDKRTDQDAEITIAHKENGHLRENVVHYAQEFLPRKRENAFASPVQLTAIKNLDIIPNGVSLSKS
ncbi:nose resistant to fluoxetine protein 6 [Parasteatoda tepidariorum]|uniref:nose resistant to fluoxetine protein 6 n=1 Tax=Parasteatoda tepidariorum TaxID=114398 RepID=UPI0039BD4BC5